MAVSAILRVSGGSKTLASTNDVTVSYTYDRITSKLTSFSCVHPTGGSVILYTDSDNTQTLQIGGDVSGSDDIESFGGDVSEMVDIYDAVVLAPTTYHSSL